MDGRTVVGLAVAGGLIWLALRPVAASAATGYAPSSPDGSPPASSGSWLSDLWAEVSGAPATQPSPSYPDASTYYPDYPLGETAGVPSPEGGYAIDEFGGVVWTPPPADAPAATTASEPGFFEWLLGGAPTAPSVAGDPLTNMEAVKAMIAYAEGTDPNSYGWSPYAVTVGYEFPITDFRDHPANLGWAGNTRAGVRSTAAGKYQALQGTWNDFQRARGAHDFSPASQEEFAEWAIVDKRRAGAEVAAGNLPGLLAKLSWEWASLPASPNGSGRYGQPMRSYATLASVYQGSGGTLA